MTYVCESCGTEYFEDKDIHEKVLNGKLKNICTCPECEKQELIWYNE